jgi:uncharacterized protein (DUF2252 family)
MESAKESTQSPGPHLCEQCRAPEGVRSVADGTPGRLSVRLLARGLQRDGVGSCEPSVTGIHAVIDGDAHLNNFGLFGTPQRDVIFDLNDFDEVTVGPWEWDLKRLTASVNVAGREKGLSRRERRSAVMNCVSGYRMNANRLQRMGVLEISYIHAYPGRTNSLPRIDRHSEFVLMRALERAFQQTNTSLLMKMGKRGANGGWRLRENPPVLTRVSRSTREEIIDGLNGYAKSLSPERRYMFSQYHAVDVAHRIVGVGSVGTRAYLVLLFGNGEEDPLFLQVKEAVVPAHAAYLPPALVTHTHQGRRVVLGQRALQASSDVMLGWTTVDGRPYYVRQMKDLKGSIPLERLTGRAFKLYAWACGAILARGHARTGDVAFIAGYCGNSKALDDALADWAEAYGDQTQNDHALLLKAIRSGVVKATIEV